MSQFFEKLKQPNRSYIIAEIGGNFVNFDQAKQLIDGAKYSGVDCVKLQTYKAETISIKNAFFDMENTGKISQYEFFKKYELSQEMHRKVIEYIELIGLDWFSTPSHETDVDLLLDLKTYAFKIGADDANNIPFLKYIAKTGLPIVFSTGMCTLEEIRESIDCILKEGNEKIAILHTISGYPTYPEMVNLNIISTLKNTFPEFPIGFSDHTLGPLACIAAASIGADILERHFTYNKNADGPDHMISSEPDEMKYIVDSVRTIEIMKGSSIKKPYGPEINNRINNRKSITAKVDIISGEKLTLENICIKRPGTGINPKYLDHILGKTVKVNFKEDDLITWGDIC